jgi:ferredoxin--NADP+ reductase
MDPVLPAVQVNLVRPTDPVVGRVVSNELCTKAGRKAAGFVRHVSIDVTGTPLAGSFVAGQSFGVLPPDTDELGRPHKVRLYSIASPTRGEDGSGTVLATTVKRLLDEHWEDRTLFRGVCSNYLCDAKPGDEIRITGPCGKRFVLPEDPSAHDYVFFATGTGVAPFRGMITDLLESGCESRVALVMGVPYSTDLLYDAEMLDLAERHPNFRYITAISRENQADLAMPLYVQDRILHDPLGTAPGSVADMLASSRSLVYVCGLAGMELGVIRAIYTALGRESAGPLLEVADEAAADPASWTRRMLNRQIKVSRRVFLEVY